MARRKVIVMTMAEEFINDVRFYTQKPLSLGDSVRAALQEKTGVVAMGTDTHLYLTFLDGSKAVFEETAETTMINITDPSE